MLQQTLITAKLVWESGLCLSTIINADWVLVLNEGRLVEQGTHLSLLENTQGLYKRLYEMQFGAAEGEEISLLLVKDYSWKNPE